MRTPACVSWSHAEQRGFGDSQEKSTEILLVFSEKRNVPGGSVLASQLCTSLPNQLRHVKAMKTVQMERFGYSRMAIVRTVKSSAFSADKPDRGFDGGS